MLKIPIHPMRAIIIPIKIAGPEKAREIDALLDTGASYLVIPSEDAIDLGYDLARAPKFPAVTANGIVEAPLVVLKSVQVGFCIVQNVPAMVLNMAGNRISALLGLSFLSHFKVLVDSKSGFLVIDHC